MQVFIPSASCLQTARQLDRVRLNKQIIEAGQILKAIDYQGKGWHNHPATRMYRPHKQWLICYQECLKAFFEGRINDAASWDMEAAKISPDFLTEELCAQHRRRLFTKNPVKYAEFSAYGTSEENWYVVDGVKLVYINGKQVRRA